MLPRDFAADQFNPLLGPQHSPPAQFRQHHIQQCFVQTDTVVMYGSGHYGVLLPYQDAADEDVDEYIRSAGYGDEGRALGYLGELTWQ